MDMYATLGASLCSTAARMAAIASVAGDPAEVAFWRGLPATLAALKRALPPAIKARLQTEAPQPTELESGILKAFSLGTSPGAVSMNNRCRMSPSWRHAH